MRTLLLVLLIVALAEGFRPAGCNIARGALARRVPTLGLARRVVGASTLLRASSEGSGKEGEGAETPGVNIEEETKKYGFEVGLFKSLTNKGTASIKPADLLKKYGAAYLITSISLDAVSFSLCYVLVSQGVDVAALLRMVGIESSDTANNVGTAGLAYAVHKAASPIRFPPTVALTPVVANWISAGKTEQEES